MHAIIQLVAKLVEPVLLRGRLEAQSKFLADIAHELQTPLAILRGNIDLLMKGETHEPQNNLWVMKTTVDRMAQSTEKLLAVGKLQFKSGALHKTEVNIKEFLENICEDCAVLAKRKRVKLSWRSDEVFVMGDREKLREVIMNLISNALKHTPAGGAITLTGKRGKKHAEIAVADTGSGIAKEYLAHIFERFYRIDKADVPGMGLGLHICQGIVHAHGGTITAESELGKGSRFTVALPLGIIN